ncbi:hypothetical protein Q3A86_18790 [Streptomyces sp. NBUA17]|uniref:hypothetical protein n=1 Tax=Streptomyces sp. NBUA17 TaxID=3062275 RepID=UPI0037D9F1B1
MLVDVDVDLVDGRREVRRVVHEFGEQVHDALGGEPGDRGLRRAVQPHAVVGRDPAGRAAQDALHHDRLVPRAAGPAAHQECQPVGHQAELRGAVVQVEQVAEDLFTVPLLHLAQVGEHADGLGLDAAQRLRRGGPRDGGPPLADGEFADEGVDRLPQRGGRREAPPGQHGVGGAAVLQLRDRGGQDLPRQPLDLLVDAGQRLLGTQPFGVQGGGALRGLLHGGGEDLHDLAELGVAGLRHLREGVVRGRAVAQPGHQGRHGDVDQVGRLRQLLARQCGQPLDLGALRGGRPPGPLQQQVVDDEGDREAQPPGAGGGARPGAGRVRCRRHHRAHARGGQQQHGRRYGQ